MLVAFNALCFRNADKKIQGDASSFTVKYVLQFRNIDEKWKSISSVIPLCRGHLKGDMLHFSSLFHFAGPMEKKKPSS